MAHLGMEHFDRFVLAEYPHHRAPRRYLVDTRRHINHEPISTDLAKAWVWTDRSGAYQLMRRHPHLKRKFFVLALTLEQYKKGAGNVPARRVAS